MAKVNALSEIKKIILHCSDSDNPVHDSVEVIRQWHLQRVTRGKKWIDIGYHFVITKYSGVQFGRPVDIIGAHTEGHNKDSIAICLTGLKVFTADQILNCQKLCFSLCYWHGLDERHIFGHNHFNKGKDCPVFDITVVRQYVYDHLRRV